MFLLECVFLLLLSTHPIVFGHINNSSLENANNETFKVCYDDITLADGCHCLSNPENLDVKCDYETRHKNRKPDVEYITTTNIEINPDKYNVNMTINVAMQGNHIQHLSAATLLPQFAHQVKELYLGNNQISRIDANAFDGFEKLKNLELKDNQIGETINSGWMSEKLGKTLRHLDLENNNITNISDHAFDNLPNLKRLVLNHNPFVNIPSALTNLPRLEYLHLDAIHIKRIPPSAFNGNNHLKELHLTNLPSLHTIDDCAFCGLPNLEIINLNNNKNLTSIHENAFGFTNERVIIRLQNTGITELPRKLLLLDNDYIQLEFNPLNENNGKELSRTARHFIKHDQNDTLQSANENVRSSIWPTIGVVAFSIGPIFMPIGLLALLVVLMGFKKEEKSINVQMTSTNGHVNVGETEKMITE